MVCLKSRGAFFSQRETVEGLYPKYLAVLRIVQFFNFISLTASRLTTGSRGLFEYAIWCYFSTLGVAKVLNHYDQLDKIILVLYYI
jgi:hypothetical protein